MRQSIRWAGAVLVAIAAAAPAAAETLIERGQYLVRSIAACGNCHTPRGPSGPIASMELAGGNKFEEKNFTAFAPNITPDKETGIGRWRDQQIIDAIREGKRPDGTTIGPPMPFDMYRYMSDNDVKAITAFIKSLRPIKNKVPKSEYKMPLPDFYGPKVRDVPYVPKTNKLPYGRDRAGPLGHCIECHTPMLEDGRRDFANRLGAGGEEFHGPWGTSVASNITPTNLARYTDSQLKAIITRGERPDGSKLLPPMGVSYYANINETDLEALIMYLRSLPRK
jgi:mono/diheme cytochrome c family protein